MINGDLIQAVAKSLRPRIVKAVAEADSSTMAVAFTGYLRELGLAEHSAKLVAVLRESADLLESEGG